MQIITYSSFRQAAKRASIRIEELEGGTLRLTPKHLFGWLRLENRDHLEWIERASIVCYLCGRERVPALRGFANKRLGRGRSVLALKKHRYLKITSGMDLKKIVLVIGRLGWCVDNDIYVFEESGRWMWYVGHDDWLFYFASK